jgi:hypothetical protein
VHCLPQESGTFCFFQGDTNSEVLLIFGHREEALRNYSFTMVKTIKKIDVIV